jgi:hypothetical protein
MIHQNFIVPMSKLYCTTHTRTYSIKLNEICKTSASYEACTTELSAVHGKKCEPH